MTNRDGSTDAYGLRGPEDPSLRDAIESCVSELEVELEYAREVQNSSKLGYLRGQRDAFQSTLRELHERSVKDSPM